MIGNNFLELNSFLKFREPLSALLNRFLESPRDFLALIGLVPSIAVPLYGSAFAKSVESLFSGS